LETGLGSNEPAIRVGSGRELWLILGPEQKEARVGVKGEMVKELKKPNVDRLASDFLRKRRGVGRGTELVSSRERRDEGSSERKTRRDRVVQTKECRVNPN